MDADLVEEVARIYGYDNLPTTLPVMNMTDGVLTPKQSKEQLIRHTLVDLGLHETLTYTLTSEATVNEFNLFHSLDNTVKLMSPLGEERSAARKSLIGSLLQTIHYNNAHSNKDVNIFEIANTYSDKEVSNLAIAVSGDYVNVPWMGKKEAVDFYLVKGFVETLFKKLCIEESRYTFEKVEADNKDFHPGRSGYIKMGKEIVGVIGQVHPAKAKAYEVNDTYVAELNLTAILALRTRALKFKAIPLYPAVSRDIALVVDSKVPAADVVKTIKRASKQLVKNAEVFDVYEGEHMEEGKKSLAISLLFQDPSRTLDDATINSAMEKILEACKKDHNAVLRG